MDTINNSRQNLGILFKEYILWCTNFKSLVIFSSFLLIYVTFNGIRKLKRNLPPGPSGLPIVGYIPFLTKNVHLQFIELGKKYGEMFSLQLGSQLVVVLNTADVIRETLTKPAFQGRPRESSVAILGRLSPFFGSGNDIWNGHRKLFQHAMKDLGFGKSSIEEQIQGEAYRFVEALGDCYGESVDPQPLLAASISNNICSMVYGERYDYEDPERREMDRNLTLSTEILAQASLHVFCPWLRRLPFLKFPDIKAGCRASKDNRNTFRKKIREHEDTLDPAAVRDFIDMYLVEMRRKKKQSTLSEEALLGSVGDIFGAGSETVRVTILWCMYVLAAFPDVQSRVRREIGEIVGPDRRPEFLDLRRMPRTHSFIMEVMRWKNIAPLNLLRCTTEDTTVRGHSIPKGTTIMANFWNAHHDPDIWSEPDSFLPERFLSEDGLSVEKSANFMPFSVGKRACPGESMANVELFLYLVSVLQRFQISFPEGYEPAFQAELGLTYRLQPFKVHFTAADMDVAAD